MLVQVREEIGKVIIGQTYLIDRLLIGLLANVTSSWKVFPAWPRLPHQRPRQCIHTKFQRIQFTPDLLPSDLVGNMVYNPRENTYSTRKGPIFANLILADEINRAPPKCKAPCSNRCRNAR